MKTTRVRSQAAIAKIGGIMHGVSSGRSLEEVLNAPEKFHIGVVLLEPGLEFTVAVQSVEIDLFEDAGVREGRIAHKGSRYRGWRIPGQQRTWLSSESCSARLES